MIYCLPIPETNRITHFYLQLLDILSKRNRLSIIPTTSQSNYGHYEVQEM